MQWWSGPDLVECLGQFFLCFGGRQRLKLGQVWSYLASLSRLFQGRCSDSADARVLLFFFFLRGSFTRVTHVACVS